MKEILQRWKSLESGDGMKKVNSMVWTLRIINILAFAFVAYGFSVKFEPFYLIVAAAVFGWTLAEMNALRTRASQWPIFRKYIDWHRVHEDAK